MLIAVFFSVFVSKNVCFCVPRIIWSHWNDEGFPEDVEEMIVVSRKSLSNFTHCLLVPKTISNFLDLSCFPVGYDNVHIQGKSDYIRLCLLEKYGGVYVDSTTYVTSGNAMEWIFAEAEKAKRSVFGFRKSRSRFLIELNFYGASVNSAFMMEYKSEYERALSGSIRQYVKDTCLELQEHGYAHPAQCFKEYFLVDHVFVKVSYDNQLMMDDVLMLPSRLDQLTLCKECNWRWLCFWDRLLHDPVARSYPFIKVTRRHRMGRKAHLGDPNYNSKFVKEKDYVKFYHSKKKERISGKILNFKFFPFISEIKFK